MVSFPEPHFLLDGVRVWIQCIECFGKPELPRPPIRHHHHEYIELLYALDADMDVWINGTPVRVLTGQAILINSGEPHTLTYYKDSQYVCIKLSPRVLYLDDSSQVCFELARPFLSECSLQRLFGQHELEGLDLHVLFTGALSEWKQRQTAYELCIRADVLNIFAGILRLWSKQNVFPARAVLSEPIRRALRYLSENVDCATAQSTADACGLSYHYFSAAFKRDVGRSFVEYLTLLRLSEAERLLVTTEQTVTEVAFSCGFSSTSHFISRFRARRGITPAQARRRARGTGGEGAKQG